MNRKITLSLLSAAFLAVGTIHAQYVGVGTPTPGAKIDVVQTETAGSSIEVNHDITTNASSAVYVRNSGTNRGLHVVNLNATANAVVGRLYQPSNGANAHGLLIDMDINTVNSTTGLFVNQAGLGYGGYFLMPGGNANPGVIVDHAGTGDGLQVLQLGTGDGIFNQVAGGNGQINIIQSNAVGVYSDLTTAGGTGGFIDLDVQDGTGYYVLGQDAGTGPTAGGDVYAFFGNVRTASPTAAGTVFGSVIAGNQSGSGHGAIITHSGVLGRNAEFNITNAANPDAAVFAISNGTGNVVIAQNQNNVLPAAVSVGDFSYTGTDVDDHIGVEGASTPVAGFGVGVLGTGNFYGVFSNGNFGATGTKTFLADHPLDPANKFLRHFSIESDEVLNMYRGTVELDANGEAMVDLPDYFDAVNTNVTYQLTAIGTPQQPYVLEEAENNQFKVAGAPNTKVSWMVIAERNDAYMQTHPEVKGAVFAKEGPRKGKYITPEFYGQPASKGYIQPKEKAVPTTELEIPTQEKEVKKLDENQLNRPQTNSKGSEDLTKTK